MVDGPRQSQVDERVRQYRALFEVGESIAAHRDMASLLQDLRKRLRQVVKFTGANIILYDPKRNVMRRLLLDALANPDREPITELAIDEGPGGVVWQTQQPILITDAADYESQYPRIYPRVAAEWNEFRLKTVYVYPLTSLGRRLGAMAFASRTENAWNEDDQSLLGQISKLIAIAVDNVINFETARAAETELKRRIEQLRLMLKITNEVVSQLDLQELLQTVCSSIREAMGSDIVDVSLFDAEIGQLRAFVTGFADGHPLADKGAPIPLEGGPSGLAFTSGQPVFLSKTDFEKFPSDFSRLVFEEGYRSGATIPLVAQGRKLGVLGLINKHEQEYSDDDKEFLVQLSNQVAIAVDNALNFESARKAEQEAARGRERLALLLEINNKIASSLDLRELYKAISGCLRSVLHHEYADLGLYDSETDRVQVYAVDRSDTIQFGEEDAWVSHAGTPPGLAINSRKTVLVERPDLNEFPSEGFRRAVAEGMRSGCSVPLISRDRVIGVMSVASSREGAFTADDARLLTEAGAQVAIALENALAFREIEILKNRVTSEKLYLEAEIRTEHNFEELIGSSAVFKRILKQVETVAPTDSAVLIRGESGTGKELIARAIHNLSTRRERTLVKINCAAIPTGLLESELFGHEKGAFTGAISQRIGRFELAHKGTLFLDEVGDIPLELQPKLLRVLQEQEFERLGSTRTQKVDVRLIAATNTNLEEMVADKKYRGDLYYRLNVFPVTIPPLRERREDIPALVRFFTQKYARRLKKRIEAIPSETMAALSAYAWPGNVRELEHFIERAAILTQGSDLEVSLSELQQPAAAAAPQNISTLEAAEREHILRALQETNWVVGGPNGAAARLGMKRTTLQSRIQKLGIERTGS